MVDAFFVGKISSEALDAVSIGFPVVFLIISIGAGVGRSILSDRDNILNLIHKPQCLVDSAQFYPGGPGSDQVSL